MINTEVKLGNVVTIIDHRGLTPTKLNGYWQTTGYRALSAKNIKTTGIVNEEQIRYVNEELYRKWMPIEIEKGDILLTSEGPLGELCYWDSDEKIVTSQRLFAIKTKKNVLDSRYLFYLMQTPVYQKQLVARSSGTTVTGIRQAELIQTTLSLPPLPEQHRISAILSSFDNKIELLRKENNTLEDIAQSIFKEWFIKYNFPNKDGKPYRDNNGKMIDSELGLIPDGWGVGKLGEIVEFSNGYAFKSGDLLGNEGLDCYKVFKMGNIKKGGGLNTNGKQDYIDKDKCKTLTKYILQKGDLLMSMTDMKDNVSLLGNTALMNEDNRYIVNQRVGLIRPRNEIHIDFPYLYLLTNNDPFLTNLRKGANSGVQVNLSTQAIRDSLISIPKDKQTLKDFDSLGKPLFEKIFNNEYNIKSLEKARTALLNKLIINQ